MSNSYIIIDFLCLIDRNLKDFESFENLFCMGYYQDYDTAMHAVLVKKPQLIFFNFSDEIPLGFLNDLRQYIDILPYVVAVNVAENFAYQAFKHGVLDYLLFPLKITDLTKAVWKFNRAYNSTESNKLCVRSNGDYHFLPFKNIAYLKSDNNTTEFYLQNGQIIHGFKTMKYYEEQLPISFFRIHNSYILNLNFISRINVGKAACYLLDNSIKIPFSRTFRYNIDLIIERMKI